MGKKGKSPKSSCEIPSWRCGTASHNRAKAFQSSIIPSFLFYVLPSSPHHVSVLLPDKLLSSDQFSQGIRRKTGLFLPACIPSGLSDSSPSPRPGQSAGEAQGGNTNQRGISVLRSSEPQGKYLSSVREFQLHSCDVPKGLTLPGNHPRGSTLS